MLLVFAMVFSMVSLEGFATDDETQATAYSSATKPADGTTSGQPFASGTGGSTNFRIPALVTLSDGTLVAAADARWNHSSDGWGLDTMVSHSPDSGGTWNYTFANYLGDNGNVYNSDSTAFIDPALAVTRNDTIFMLVDLYPHGTYIGNVKAGTGFDSKGHLLLRSNNDSSFDYYVGDFSNGTANIYQNDGTLVKDYTVDEYYNIEGNGVNTNLFFSDSPYQVLSTSYLYLTKSTDGGATWSAPMMLNSQVKNDGDMFYGVGPGRGLVTSTGRIIFPCYTYTTTDGNTSVIYSDDNGETWTRSANMSAQSSEATLVEADDNIYMFTRHGGYYVSKDDGETWSSQQPVGINYTTTCQLSAITYSKKIDDKTAILLSAPTNGRAAGKIFVGLVQDDGSISWDYTYSVNGSGYYAYSCLTELSDGNIGLLYENASASITYTTMAIDVIAEGTEIGESSTITDSATDISVSAVGLKEVQIVKAVNSTPYTGYTTSVTYGITLNNGDYTGQAKIKIPVDDTIFGNCDKFIGSVSGNGKTETFIVTVENGCFVGTVPHFSDVTISGKSSNLDSKDVALYVGQSKTITDSTGDYESSYTGTGLNTSIATVGVEGNTSPNKETSITSGEKYLIGDGNGNYLSLNGTTITNSTDSSNATQWTITNVGDKYTIQSGNYYLRYSANYTWGINVSTASQSWTIDGNGIYHYYSSSWLGCMVYDNSTGWTFAWNKTGTAPYSLSGKATDITITGVAAGTTSVTVGSTLYNITVKDVPDVVDMASTPFVANTGVGNGKAITKLTTSVGLTFDLDLNVTGSNIDWSVADSSIATVDQNGKVTGVKAGETTVTATIDGVEYTIPVVIRQDTTSSNVKIYDFYLSEVTNTTTYYSVSMSTDLVEAQEGEAIYISCGASDNTAVDFFAKPNEGYALTRMSSTNSAGDYMALNSDTPSQTDFCTKSGAAGSNQINTFGSAAVYAMVQAALDKDCDGGMGWTRPSSNTSGVTSDLTFRSEKLPTVSKEVATVNGEAYTEGMVARKGDKVVFNVTVTQYAAQDNITYSNASLKDNLNGATFISTRSSTQTVSGLSNTALSANKQIAYQVEYTIQDSDLDTVITNTVDLTYTYKSQYSSGSFGGTANAEAKITATTFEAKDIVIDFGLPVKVNYNAWGKDDVTLKETGKASYGTVTVSGDRINGWEVTYTPTTVLMGVDTVTLYGSNDTEYTFKVYPATTVYYEEGFANYQADRWTETGNKGTIDQKDSTVGSKDNYGYESSYSTIGISNGSEATSSTIGAYTKLEFTGTGIDVYANCSQNTGKATVQILDKDNKLIKLIIVSTTATGAYGDKVKDGAYNTPIVSIDGLAHDKYTVKVVVAEKDIPINIDGFRVYGTLGYDHDVYEADDENNPTFVELRDQVLAALPVDLTQGQYANQIANNALAQVYSKTGVTNGAVVISDPNVTADADPQTLLDEGPKNELYLTAGQSVIFNLNASNAQIGMRALKESVNYSINDVNGALNSSTDMFYELDDTAKTITITNKGEGILAITDIKAFGVTEGTQATMFMALSAEDFMPALLSMGFEEEPTAAEANLAINVVDVYGNKVAETSLVATGTEGETAEFAAADIVGAVNNVMPAGYAIADEGKVAGASVAYGDNGEATVTVGKIATLTIQYKKMFGKSISTVTLTKVQTDTSSKAQFTAAEIRAAAPEGYRAMNILGSNVKYGYSSSRTVYVY